MLRKKMIERPPVPDVVREKEKSGEIVSFAEGVQRITEEVIELLGKKRLVMYVLYGYPNSGKTTFAREVMSRLRAREEFRRLYGGEVSGYEDFARPPLRDFSQLYVCFIQQLSFPTARDVEERALRYDYEPVGMPKPDGSIVLCGPNVSASILKILQNNADLIVKNDQARRKNN